MADIGMPALDITFKGLGVSAIKRGARGVAILIVKDDTDKTFDFATYRSYADLTSAELAKYTAENQQYIKDVLDGTPLKVIVARMDETAGVLADLLAKVKGIAPRNCWIGLAEGTTTEQNALSSFVKSENLVNKKCYKTVVYQATAPDSMSVVNFTNDNVVFADDRATQAGDKAISTLLGFFAGLPLEISGIGKSLSYKFSSVIEPVSLETAINAGKLVLHSEDGDVRVVRAVNSLTTTGQDVTDDMKFILIVEQMHLVFSDIYDTWNKFYKGKYKNYMDNQLLLIGALNSYFEGLAGDLILDPNFNNETSIDLEAQRLANIPKFGEEVVNAWTDKEVMAATVGTQVYLIANVKYLNAMEDLKFKIYM